MSNKELSHESDESNSNSANWDLDNLTPEQKQILAFWNNETCVIRPPRTPAEIIADEDFRFRRSELGKILAHFEVAKLFPL